MIENKNELMLKMCASENGGIGVEVDGKFYFYEHFEDDTYCFYPDNWEF